MSPLTLATCAWEVGRPASVEAFSERLDAVAADARARGADLLLLPEYAALELAPALAGRTDEAAELAAATQAFDRLLDACVETAIRHGLWLAPGSLPRVDRDGRTRNYAPLIDPAGRTRMTAKPVMTRFEAERWAISPGPAPEPLSTPWGPIGIAICYAAEFPLVVRRLVEAGAWLVLIPACTDTPAGGARVTIAARARAMENQCFTAVSPTIGEAPWSAALDRNHGQAAIYGPVDRGFPDDGVLAALPPDQPGLAIARLDPAAIARVRADGAVRNHLDWEPVVQQAPG